ncbi:hypothetical protein WG909_09915 [Peptostreptococcaceae bacterium AGR-M142]
MIFFKGVLLSAFLTSLIFLIIYYKRANREYILTKKFLSKSKRKILKLLKDEKRTEYEILRELEKLKVFDFNTLRYVYLKDYKKFTKILLTDLLKRNIIELYSKKNKKYYTLKNTKGEFYDEKIHRQV